MDLWTPADIATAIWLDAADSSTITLNGATVSAWIDKSGNNLQATQGTASSQPTLISGGINSLDVLRFDGNSDFLTGSSPLFSGGDPATVLCVYKPRVTTGTFSVFGQSVGTTAGTWRVLQFRTQYASGDPYFAGYGADVTDSASPTTATKLAGWVYDGSTLSLYRHGALIASSSLSLNTASANFLVGKSAAATNEFANMDLAEIIVIGSAATLDTRQLCEGYLAWKWGLQANLAADHPYKSAAPTIPDPTASLRAILDQQYALLGDQVLAMLSQDWNLMLSLRNVVTQDWSLRMLQILTQYYGDVPVVRQLLEQYWGPAAMLRRLVAQPYGDALRLRAGIDQDWGLNAGLLAMMEQRYSIAGDRYLAMAEQAYNINEYNILRAALDQVSIIAADSSLVQRPVISVTADGTALDVSHISLEVDEATLAITGEIHPADQAGFLRCRHLETVVTITIDADVYTLIVEAPRSSRPEVGQEQWIVPLASPTIKLDAPYARPLTREFAGAMASAIVTELAALDGITVTWELIDWYLPAGTIYANAETPLAVVRKIVAAVGGVLQSSPAGALICRPEYPLSPPAWAAATPSHYLTDMDNFFSVDATPEIRDGWNRYLVADQDAAGELGLSLEAIDIDEHRKEVRVYQVPYNPAAVIALRTSGGSWVGIVAEGVTVETMTEQVEIVAGEGNVAKPLTIKISHDYRETVLGAITTAEDGHLRTEIDGNSLVEIVYTTTYRKFIVSDPNIEDVQFFPEEVAA